MDPGEGEDLPRGLSPREGGLRGALGQGGPPRPQTPGDLLAAVAPGLRPRLAPMLRAKPSRTASGVAVVAAMTKPFACPHGVCIFCPGGPRWGTPQSYLADEPAAMRGAQFAYDPYRQTRARI